MASIKLTGDTSGEITISAPAVAGTNTLTLPASTGNVFVTYGTAYGLKGITYLTSGTSATYTTPTGVRAIYVEVVGGGGAGGGVDGDGTNGASGGGGGGGGYSAKLITSPSASYTYTIGAGGTGGSYLNGTDGGNTTFTDGTVTLTGNGGSGGSRQAAASSNTLYAQTNGGVSSGGDINIRGTYGLGRLRGDFVSYPCQTGGSSVLGCAPAGGGAGAESLDGSDATEYGAGGQGAATEGASANASGGDGGQGVIRITEFY